MILHLIAVLSMSVMPTASSQLLESKQMILWPLPALWIQDLRSLLIMVLPMPNFSAFEGLVIRLSDGYIVAVERSYADMITAYFDKVSTGKS
jgi:hypothetical protein